jgi:hypothetical protein
MYKNNNNNNKKFFNKRSNRSSPYEVYGSAEQKNRKGGDYLYRQGKEIPSSKSNIYITVNDFQNVPYIRFVKQKKGGSYKTNSLSLDIEEFYALFDNENVKDLDKMLAKCEKTIVNHVGAVSAGQDEGVNYVTVPKSQRVKEYEAAKKKNLEKLAIEQDEFLEWKRQKLDQKQQQQQYSDQDDEDEDEDYEEEEEEEEEEEPPRRKRRQSRK